MARSAIVLAVCALLVQGGVQAQQTFANPAEAVAGNRELSTLLAGATAADLVSYLSNPSANLTILAPTNAAFATALPALNLTPEGLLRSPNLGTILRYHAIPGALQASALKDGQVVTTVLGQQLQVAVSGSTVSFKGPSNSAIVTTPNIGAGNSIVHVINAVLLPNLNAAPAGAPASPPAIAAALRTYLAGLTPAPAPSK